MNYHRLTGAFWHVLGMACLVLGCSSPPPSTRNSASTAPAATPTKTWTTVAAATLPPSPEDKAKEEALFGKAREFDAFLTDSLTGEEEDQLINSCKGGDSQNPFCYAILNRDALEDKARALKKKARRARRRRTVTVRARFNRQSKLLNWKEIRVGSLAGLIHGFSRLSEEELHQIQRPAFNETECPNNAAIAVAVSLEDYLPEGSPLDVIGRLYEKGGMCLTGNPADREQILTRAGLFYYASGDYASAAKVLSTSSQIQEAFTARALYWLYRSRLQQGDKDRAQQTLDQLKARYPFSFHTLVALTAAHQDPGEILLRSSPHEAKRSQQVQTINPLIESVEVLHKFHFADSATKVLEWAIQESRGVEPEVMIYLAELKKEEGDYQSKITILSDILYNYPSLISRETMELYFPKVYFPIFEKHSSQIDPYLLLAIARRESAFDPRAVSPARARGLLQVMPSTGRLILGHRADLFNPEINVEIGTKYILDLLKKTDGQIHMALAAYNAGVQRVNHWTERYPTSDSILFIDLIPFRETREYVASILRNYYWYRRIHQGDDSMTPERLLELANSRAGE